MLIKKNELKIQNEISAIDSILKYYVCDEIDKIIYIKELVYNANY